MKVILLLAVILILETKCHVTYTKATTETAQEEVSDQISDKLKNNDRVVPRQTTVSDIVQKPSENASEKDNALADAQPTDKQIKNKSNKYDGKHVYLEDVIFALKSKNWTKEEEPCLNSTLHMLRSLQNYTLWAVWSWDSISSQPQGLLFGNRFELGNFDECLNAPWDSSHPEIRMQYCLAEIVLERTDKPVKKQGPTLARPYDSALDFIMRKKSSIHRPLNELTWGGCVPVSCGPSSVEKLMGVLLARSHLGTAGMRARINVSEECQRPDQPRQFDSLYYRFLVLVAVLLATCLTCTYLNGKVVPGPKSFKQDLIKACCLKENAKNLLEMKKERTEVLYGIRFLSMAFIVVDHQIGFHNGGPVINGLEADKDATSIVGMLLVHDDLFVDTFFVLSGFLVATGLIGLYKKNYFNPLLMIVKRYIRLAVAYAVVIFFFVAVFPYTGSGPLWNRAVAAETDSCKKTWWHSLLMLGNYLDNDNMCILITWYIPADFHFFVVTALLFWLHQHQPRLSLAAAGVLCVASLVAPGVINYLNDMPAVQLFTYEFVRNPRASEQFHITYSKSHVRFAAYIVGFAAGYIFTVNRNMIIPKKWSILGAVSGLVVMTAVLMGGATYLWRDYHPIEGALYAALNRPLWACGVVALILCCCLGRVPLIKGFLSWYPWVPLSRLSYGLYLTHSALIMRNVFSTRSPQRNDFITLITLSCGVVVICVGAALVIWLLAEAPINNIFMLLFKPKAKPSAKNEKNTLPTSATSISSIASTSQSGYLHSNINNSTITVEISSKM